MSDRLQEWQYDRIGREGIKPNEDSLACEDGKRQTGFDIYFICLMFKVKLSDFSVKYTAHTVVSTLRVKKKKEGELRNHSASVHLHFCAYERPAVTIQN